MPLDPKKFIRNLTVGRGSILVPHLDAYLSRDDLPDVPIVIGRNKEPDPYFHPSGDCFRDPWDLFVEKWAIRQQIAKREHLGAAMRKVFDTGHFWHGYIQHALVDMGFLDPEGVEQKLTFDGGGFTARGTGDCVGVRIPGHGEWLIDIKTQRKDDFDRGFGSDMWAKYEAQVNIYGDWFKFDKMMILAVCKDSPHDFREYIVTPKPQLVDEIYLRWTFAQEMLDSGLSPDELRAAIEEGLETLQ